MNNIRITRTGNAIIVGIDFRIYTFYKPYGENPNIKNPRWKAAGNSLRELVGINYEYEVVGVHADQLERRDMGGTQQRISFIYEYVDDN